MRMTWRACAGVLLGALCLASPAAAAPGDLDTAFGVGGSVLTPKLAGLGDVATTRDGPLAVSVVVGDGRTTRWAFARYHADGRLDKNFGTGGIVTLPPLYPGSTKPGDEPFAVQIQRDGKVVAAGVEQLTASTPGAAKMVVVRLHADGSLDTGFGSGGQATLQGFDESAARAVAVLSDGRIIAAGGANTVQRGPGDPRPKTGIAMMALRPDGSPDTSFGSDGQVFLPHAEGDPTFDELIGMAVQPTGRIVLLANRTTTGSTPDAQPVLMAFTAQGAPDTTFGSNGVAGLSMHRTAKAVAVDGDGRLLVGHDPFVAGESALRQDWPPMGVSRLTRDGAVDAPFGTNGTSLVRAGRSNRLADLVLQPDGRILAVAGTSIDERHGADEPRQFFTVARLLPTGAIDRAFGTEGITFAGPEDGTPNAAALLGNRLLASGSIFPRHNEQSTPGVLAAYELAAGPTPVVARMAGTLPAATVVAAGGVPVPVTCPRACRATGQVASATGVVLARGTLRLTRRGSVRMLVRLTPRGRRAVRGRSPVHAKLVIQVKIGRRTITSRQPLAFSR